MSIGTMESHATVTEGGKRRSGFLGFGRKKDKANVAHDEDEVSDIVLLGPVPER